MARYIEVTLKKRGVSCVAQLLDDLAPKTAEAVWGALPQEGDAFHAKFANNEVYTLVPPFASERDWPRKPNYPTHPRRPALFLFPARDDYPSRCTRCGCPHRTRRPRHFLRTG